MSMRLKLRRVHMVMCCAAVKHGMVGHAVLVCHSADRIYQDACVNREGICILKRMQEKNYVNSNSL